MTHWQHEYVDELLNSKHFWVDDAGPLTSPVCDFSLTRGERDRLLLKSQSDGKCGWSAKHAHPVGTVRENRDKVSFGANNGARLEAIGVQPRSFLQIRNSEGTVSCEELSDVQLVTCELRPGDEVTYTIDWLDNLQTDSGVWIGSIVKDESERAETRTFGHDNDVVLTRRDMGLDRSNKNVLHLNIDGLQIYLGKTDRVHARGRITPGYIIYLGAPDNDERTRIREILSYCLGNYLVYLGSSFLSETSELVGLTAVSPPNIGVIAEVPAHPPSPLGDLYEMEVNQRHLEQMANALYTRYDDLHFSSLSWAYWHAVCAPVHMKAAHFGAALEALQRTPICSTKAKSTKRLITQSQWGPIETRLLHVVENSDIETDIKKVLSNKIRSNLNQVPPTKIQDEIFAEIGLVLGDLEKAAWKRRNQAAHGQPVNDTNAIDTIRETKLLKVVFHRMMMTITGANLRYYDDYTVGRPVRRIIDPVPS